MRPQRPSPTGSGPRPRHRSSPLRPRPQDGLARSRAALERHVAAVQQQIRSCAGCGLCCTAAHNTVRILPLEAARVAAHLRSLPLRRRDTLLRRLRAAVARFGLHEDAGKVRYTCPFLEKDLTCALPLAIKPVACLSFNPLTPDRCDQEPAWYATVRPHLEKANAAGGLPQRRVSIPVAALRALAEGWHLEAWPVS